MKVYIADDSDVVRERLTTIISEITEVEIIGETGNAFEAIEAIRKLKPDVVILDIRMPGRNGIDVLKSIKKGESPPVAIMLTNYPYPQYRKKCMALGADFFFDKSTEFEKVTEVVKQLIQDSHNEKREK